MTDMKLIRESLGYNQEAFASLIGVDPVRVNEVENGAPFGDQTAILLGLMVRRPEVIEDLKAIYYEDGRSPLGPGPRTGSVKAPLHTNWKER